MPRALALLPLLALAGCQLAPKAPPAPQETEGVIRGQGPPVLETAPWGPSYLAPGELSCETPPPLGLGYEVVAPTPYAFAAPGVSPPVAAVNATPEPTAGGGWFDVLPPDGGPISDDFGLPKHPKIENRLSNPLYVRATNPDAAWEAIAATVARYQPIRSEQRVMQQGSMLTEGRIETKWRPGSTIFEPWRRDSAGAYDRWQSTLQTIRRRTTVRVMPAAGGYELDVRVDKQLEDLNRPERASAGAASIRNDASLPTDRVTPVDSVRDSGRWIDIGRDEALEQRILKRLARRFGAQ